MLLKLLISVNILLWSNFTYSQNETTISNQNNETWHCAAFAYQYKIVVKTRNQPNFPGDLCSKITENQHDTKEIIIALGTEVDLVIYPKNAIINTNLQEVSYESY